MPDHWRLGTRRARRVRTADDAADEEADDIMAQLVELFKTENGREPTEEEVQQWMQTLKEAAEDGGLAL